MPTFQHDHYQRNFAVTAPPETQLVFDFMFDVSARDPNAPDELALRIVRGIFRDASAEGWSISTDAIATKIVNHREHTPPVGMPERRQSSRQEEKPQAPLRQAMRPPTAVRVDLSETRMMVSTPGYMVVKPLDYAAPARRLGIVLALIVAYVQVLSYPQQVHDTFAAIGTLFKNVQNIATVIEHDGVKGTANYRGGVPAAVAKER